MSYIIALTAMTLGAVGVIFTRRNQFNLLTPFYMQSLGLDLQDLVDDAQPFVD